METSADTEPTDVPSPEQYEAQMRLMERETSAWVEWSRLTTKLSLGSAMRLCEELLEWTEEGFPTSFEWPASPTRWHFYAASAGFVRVPTQTTHYRSYRLGSARRFLQSAELIAEQLIHLEYVHPQVDLIASSYTLRARSQVLNFLWRYPHLEPLLAEAPREIERHFPSAELSLQVVADREVDGWEELLIMIATNLPTDEAARALERLDEEWWLDRLPDAHGKLSIDLEFE